MEVVVKGEPKEIAALILKLQEQHKEKDATILGPGVLVDIQSR